MDSAFVMAHLLLSIFTDMSFKDKKNVMNKMELHKDDMQLLLIVLAHGLNFCVVAVVLSSLSFSAA